MPRRTLLLLAMLCWLDAGPRVARAQPDNPANDERDRSVMARFLSVVEKAPRRGTALDRVYSYHVERGTLDSFLKSYQDRVAADPKDGVAWMILGLVESQRGRDAAAVAALRKAEEARPDDAMPSYYLGQSLVLVGQPDDSAQAFERAIARKPGRADLLEIFQALGRVYQRAHRNDQAMAVWSRLEKQFPDDPRVQEQIAASLAEESQPEQALPRYEALAKSTRDRFRQVQFQVDAAELKARLNRGAEALADYEGLLSRLDPESWLHREVRRKIEEMFTRTDDQAGLAAYYEKWVGKNPDDVEAMARLGRALAVQGRLGEARSWYEKAVNLAPTRRDLRTALIEQLLIERKFPEAAAQYEAIAKADPSNPDAIREWGKVLLRDTSKPEADRRKAAAGVWRRLVEARPEDPSTLVMVADLLRQAEMVDEAIDLYRKAADAAPNAPQYAEYLGEFYHKLKRPREAVATWSKMAEPPNRNARTLGRLAEVYSGFGYKAEALAAAAEAAGLDRDDFDLQLRYADLLHLADRLDDERTQLAIAARAATGPEQAEGVLDREIKNVQAAGTLPARVEALRKDLDAGTDATAERWRRLARYQEADQKPSEALASARKALAIDPRSTPALAMIARLDEALGDLSGSADALRKLAEVDRRNRTEYLTGIARLEARLGRKEAALKAGRDLLAAAPGQLDNHQFFAELCFQLGQVDEGLDALRRAVRLNEADPKALTSLAETLAQQFRTDEAIEMFWRAFERSPDLDAKLSVISRLTALYLQRNQFDRLIARLERQGREADRQREMAICLAQAYSASGDFGTARSELERLLSANPRDTKLLSQLSTLAETEGDPVTAAKFQKQLVDLAPGEEAVNRLATLHVQAGDVAEAEAIWARMAANGEPDSGRVLMAVDSLLGHGKREAVLGITENLLRKHPDNWEALYREAQAIAGLGRVDEAAKRFRAILDVKGSDDDLGAVARAKKKGAARPVDPNAPGAAANPYAPPKTFPLQDRLSKINLIRSAAGFDARMTSSAAWAPDDLGQARMAALGWLENLAQRAGTHDELVRSLRAARDKAPSDPRPHWDLFYLQAVRVEYAEMYEAARGLSRAAPADPAAQFAFLNTLPVRDKNGMSPIYTPVGPNAPDPTPPLPDAEVDQVLASYGTLKALKPDWAHAAMLTAIADELRRARRPDDLERYYRAAVEAPADADSTASVLRLAAERGDVDAVLRLFDRYERLLGNKAGATFALYVFYGGYYALASSPSDSIGRAMLARADARAHADVARLLDHYLLAARRPERIQKRARAGTTSSPNGRAPRFQVWAGKTARFTSLPYPSANPYYDLAAIQVLRNAFELYKRDDLLSDLKAHLRESLAAGSDVDRAYTRLALCYLAWWDEDKDEALKELAEAVAASKSDPELVLSLAELRAQRSEPEEALRVADSFEPLDQKALLRREVLAIRLAVLTGDVARARKAAERLFGLRLDADIQVQLAAQMHQLGMHELAEAILGRARRRAGGNAAALTALMTQYQRQGKVDVAVQVAHQILRKNASRPMAGYYDEGDEARREATQVLARSGRIKEMIARVEAQLARTPGSLQLHQTLADYFRATGEKDRVKAEYDAIAGLRPDDARLRYQIANDLIRSGDSASAIEHFKAALKKEPSLFGANFYQIQSAFEEAGKSADLLALVEEADIRSIGQIYYLARFLQSVLRGKATRDRGLALFAKAWKAYPTQREYLFVYMQDEETWQLPGMYEYVREATLPAEGRASMPTWAGFDDTLGYSNGGRTATMGSRLVELAARQGKLESLTADLERAEARLPAWRAGRALRGLALARRGRPEEARAVLAPIADTRGLDAAPATARMVIGQALEDSAPLRPLALAFLEEASKGPEAGEIMYAGGPVQGLVESYRKLGRPDDARRELIAFSRRTGGGGGYDAAIAAYYRILDRSQVATTLREIGFPADAARIFDELLADTDGLEQAAPYFGGTERQVGQFRQGLEKALAAFDSEAKAAALRAQSGPGVASPDLLLIVHPRELDRAAVASLLGEAIRSAGPGKAREALAGVVERGPRDVPARVALVLAEFAEGTPEASGPALAGLIKLVEESPMEPLAAGDRANARQRAEAARQLGLWLVARECARRPGCREAGRALADRAIEAARRQADPAWLLAMLREAGQDAVDRGDAAEAEARWSAMLGKVLVTPASAKAEPGKPAPVPVATLERFEQAARMAKLAASRGLTSLSIRAVRESLRGGPPIVPLALGTTNVRVIRNNAADTARDRQVAQAVEGRLSELESSWDSSQVPPAEIYEVLRDVVMPEGRPSEVFCYPRPMPIAGPTAPPRSTSALLVRWAIRAGRADDLRARAEARAQKPTAEGAARALLVQLDLARGDRIAAARGLERLEAKLREDKLPSTAELAGLAALPCLALPEAEKPASTLLDLAATTFGTSNNEPAAGRVRVALARRHFAAGRAEAGSALLRTHLEALDRATAANQSRYAASGGMFATRQQNLRTIAAEYARGGRWAEALESLGLAADAPPPPFDAAGGPTPAPVAVARHLAGMTPIQRYETLRAWTLPADARSSARVLVAFAPTEVPPESFGRFPAPDASGVIATPELLIAAAREAGKLDELAAQVTAAAAKKAENAEAIRVLVEVARGRGGEVEGVLRALLAEWSRPVEGPAPNAPGMEGNRPKPIPWADYLQVRAALAEPGLAELGRAMAAKLEPRARDQALKAHLRLDVAASLAAREGSKGVRAGLDPGLAFWGPAGSASAAIDPLGMPPSWWVAHSGIIAHRAGPAVPTPPADPWGAPVAATPPPRPDSLVFHYPMAGHFEVSVEATGPGVEFGYGGMALAPSAQNSEPGGSFYNSTPRVLPPGQVRAIGSGASIARPSPFVAADGSNRLTIRVEPGSVRYLANGHLVFEDRDPSPNSPWLVLGASGLADADFRDLRISGTPEIPREVRLTHGDRLDGWLADFYAETRPARELGPDGRPRPPIAGAPAASMEDRDWSARAGQILGRRNPAPTTEGAAESRLAYHRPIRPGEVISYEFFHEPDAVMVHPALGRLAFLIEPGGVRLHWMTDGPEVDPSGLEPGNVADEPSSRRGPAPLPLRPGDWNRLKLALNGRSVELELNGVKVLERDLEAGNDRVFSLYHDKDRTAAKVRDVVLRGDWPATLPALDLARRLEAPDAAADRRARHALIGDAAIGRGAGRLLRATQGLPPDARYRALAGWVLPDDDRPGFRLAGDFAPTDPPLAASPEGLPPAINRVEVGGTFDAPALAMVEAAKAAGHLDELAGLVEKAPAATDLDRRGRLALLATIRAAQGHDAEAGAALAALLPLLEKVGPDAPESERWPELVAVAGTLGRPATREAARALADRLVPDASGKEPRGLTEAWRLQALRLAARAARPNPAAAAFEADPGLAGWARVTHSTARSRGTGAPLPRWVAEGGALWHLRGHDRDYLYLRVPLLGDFDLTAEVVGRHPVQLAYGGLAVGVAPDGKEVVVTSPGRPVRRATLEPPMALVDGPHRVRLSVKGGILAAFLDDRKLFEEGLAARPDPWLALYQPAADLGTIRGLKLEGRPTVPDRLELSGNPDLDGWRPDDPDAPASPNEPAWQDRAGEILGRAVKDAPNSARESLLRYHRPLVEDGEVACEFYYEPGVAQVHPALDRLAFVIAPDGVKLHQVSDGRDDRTGLAPDNLADDPGGRRGPDALPLKPGAWNRLALAVKGDSVAIRLNDVLVLERPIEPTNQRTFGLFHFADQGEARVRNVTYRGDWAKQVPADLGFKPAGKE